MKRLFGVPLSGTLWVAGGTALLGLSGYAFLTLTAGRVGHDGYAALASLYLLVALIGPALFFPAEQELTRLVSRADALGQGARAEVRRMGALCVGLAALGAGALVAAYPLLVHRVFHGYRGLWWALLASVLGFGALALLRGVFAGRHQLGRYAACLSVDGLVRLVPTAAFAGLGVTSVLPYGLALGLGPAVAFLALAGWYRRDGPGPVTPWRELLVATSSLVAAWGLSLVLANLAPVVVTALLPAQPARAGVFAFAFVVARVPVFVLVSLQAVLLPALTRAAVAEDGARLRRGVGLALRLVALLGLAGLLLTAPLCRWLIGLLFGGPERLSAAVLTALAAGTVLAMLVQVLQPALIAGTDHQLVAAAWLAGAVVFGACFALPVDPVVAATIAQVAGYAVTAGLMAGVVRLRFRQSRQAAP